MVVIALAASFIFNYMSLKKILFEAIKNSPDYLTLDQANAICDFNGYKRSNMERRLRPSESPAIIEVKNDRGCIIGYKYIEPKPHIPPKNKEQERLFNLPPIMY